MLCFHVFFTGAGTLSARSVPPAKVTEERLCQPPSL